MHHNAFAMAFRAVSAKGRVHIFGLITSLVVGRIYNSKRQDIRRFFFGAHGANAASKEKVQRYLGEMCVKTYCLTHQFCANQACAAALWLLRSEAADICTLIT